MPESTPIPLPIRVQEMALGITQRSQAAAESKGMLQRALPVIEDVFEPEEIVPIAVDDSQTLQAALNTFYQERVNAAPTPEPVSVAAPLQVPAELAAQRPVRGFDRQAVLDTIEQHRGGVPLLPDEINAIVDVAQREYDESNPTGVWDKISNRVVETATPLIGHGKNLAGIAGTAIKDKSGQVTGTTRGVASRTVDWLGEANKSVRDRVGRERQRATSALGGITKGARRNPQPEVATPEEDIQAPLPVPELSPTDTTPLTSEEAQEHYFCSKCGTRLIPGQSACPSCGARELSNKPEATVDTLSTTSSDLEAAPQPPQTEAERIQQAAMLAGMEKFARELRGKHDPMRGRLQEAYANLGLEGYSLEDLNAVVEVDEHKGLPPEIQFRDNLIAYLTRFHNAYAQRGRQTSINVENPISVICKLLGSHTQAEIGPVDNMLRLTNTARSEYLKSDDIRSLNELQKKYGDKIVIIGEIPKDYGEIDATITVEQYGFYPDDEAWDAYGVPARIRIEKNSNLGDKEQEKNELESRIQAMTPEQKKARTAELEAGLPTPDSVSTNYPETTSANHDMLGKMREAYEEQGLTDKVEEIDRLLAAIALSADMHEKNKPQ